MSDDTNAIPTTQPVDSAAAPPAKDPLAVLEELLAKQKSSAGGSTAGQPTPAPVVDDKAAEAARREAEYERLKVEAEARDAQQLVVQEQKMKEIATSPQYQARVEQNKAVKDEKQHSSEELQGFEITQLSTTRVPATTQPTE